MPSEGLADRYRNEYGLTSFNKQLIRNAWGIVQTPGFTVIENVALATYVLQCIEIIPVE